MFGLLGLRQRERDSVIGVVLAFGLGLGVLLLALYPGRASNKFGLLTGSIVSMDSTNLWLLGGVAVSWWGAARTTGRCCSPARTPRSRWPAGPVRVLSLVFAVLIGADDGAGGADRRGDPRALGDDRPARAAG